MRALRRFFQRLGGLTTRGRQEARMREEIAAHLAMQAEENERAGMPAGEARRQAALKFGSVSAAEEGSRGERRLLFFETLLQDLRFAMRMLIKSPGFSAVAILTLALGIGVNAAIFSVVDAVLFTDMPVEDPRHVVVFTSGSLQKPKYHGHSDYGDCDRNVECSFSVPFFEAVRAQTTSFSGVAAFAGPLQVDFKADNPAEIAEGEYVSGEFFSTLGVSTLLGRGLGPADDVQGAPPAIVLNYGYWQREFKGDPAMIGRTVHLNNVEATIVGVANKRFLQVTPGKTQDFFMPLALASRVRAEWWREQDRLTDPTVAWVVVVGRLKPGVSVAQAQAEASPVFRNQMLYGSAPMLTAADEPAIHLLPARDGLTGEVGEIAPIMALVQVAVGFVLLIACANVAGLILARSAGRQKEMAMRQALGARRWRLARQLLTECVVLACAGGALGIVFSVWGVKTLMYLVTTGVEQPFPFAVRPDWRVMAFLAGMTLIAGVLSGLAPALLGANTDLTGSLREIASSKPGSSHTGRWMRLGDALVVVQVALSIVVLIGAGLLVRSLRNLETINPGFETRNVLLFGLNPNIAGYKDRQTTQLYDSLQQRLAALPSVTSVSYSGDSLLSGSWSSGEVHLDSAAPKDNFNTATLAIGLDFFSTMKIPMLAGRSFSPSDFAAASEVNAAQRAEAAAEAKLPPGTKPQPVSPSAPKLPAVPILINQTFANRAFPNQDPLGRHIGDEQTDDPETLPLGGYRVIGVVGDTKYNNLRKEIVPTMYTPLAGNSAHFELRTTGDPMALAQLVRTTLAKADANLPIFAMKTQTEQVQQTLFHDRLLSKLFGFFALLALVLACIGLYGLLSFDVTRRTREIGIRVALGARRLHLFRLVVRQGIVLVLAGAVLGIGAAIGITRFMTGMLYNVHATDPVVFVGVFALLILVALVACAIPARRALGVDPIVALREE